jgi:hypothetical protein
MLKTTVLRISKQTSVFSMTCTTTTRYCFIAQHRKYTIPGLKLIFSKTTPLILQQFGPIYHDKMPKCQNFGITEVLQRHSLPCTGLLKHVPMATMSWNLTEGTIRMYFSTWPKNQMQTHTVTRMKIVFKLQLKKHISCPIHFSRKLYDFWDNETEQIFCCLQIIIQWMHLNYLLHYSTPICLVLSELRS